MAETVRAKAVLGAGQVATVIADGSVDESVAKQPYRVLLNELVPRGTVSQALFL